MQSELISRDLFGLYHFFLLLTGDLQPAGRVHRFRKKKKKNTCNFSFSVVGLIRRQRALKQTNAPHRPLCPAAFSFCRPRANIALARSRFYRNAFEKLIAGVTMVTGGGVASRRVDRRYRSLRRHSRRKIFTISGGNIPI